MYSYGLRARFLSGHPTAHPVVASRRPSTTFRARLELRQTHPSGLPSWSGCFQPAKKNTAASSAFTDFIFMTFVQAHLRRKDQLLKP
jgi:hypothetical protein